MKTSAVHTGKNGVYHAVYLNVKYMGHVKEVKVSGLDDDGQDLATALGMTYFDTCYLADGLPFLTIDEAAAAIISNKSIYVSSSLN
jgi:hypothetical protein